MDSKKKLYVGMPTYMCNYKNINKIREVWPNKNNKKE